MILELAILNVVEGRAAEFERAFAEARAVISSMPGFVSLELGRDLKHSDRYVLLVRWQTLEDHTVGFRQSPEYETWKSLLHHFYEPFPSVEHFEPILKA